MTRYSFEIQWPAPFSEEWKRSGRTWLTAQRAAEEMAEYLSISADNGIILQGRLAVLPNYMED